MRILGFLAVIATAFTGTYGINYGIDNIPTPDKVVRLLKAAKIKNVRIYDADHSVLNAFKGTGLELVIGLPNDYVKEMNAKHMQCEGIPSTHIVGIAVGNEVLGGNDYDLSVALLGAVKNIYNATKKLGIDDLVQISTAPKIDAAYAALEDAGFKKMEVIITETGWASHGDQSEPAATPSNARTYHYNLRKRLAKRKGTPMRPKSILKAYIFALFNENSKGGAGSEKYYGLFKADGSISYDIGFPGLKSSYASSSRVSFKSTLLACYALNMKGLILYIYSLFGADYCQSP
ncbi:UNVERIFIED_CONTAM: Glucan endo-1,3-beta-D-glucosidase [Sesamum calycinum]|uniref:Glucan endo-1,3-beta-D-glucosidase n=1 Tax=Sesamum calycinum TaxID=2727403 RepID=A0AAW2N3C3_9LAMI